MKIALAQLAPTPLAIADNLGVTARVLGEAAAQGAGLVVFPELSLTGYELDGIAATPAAWFTADDARLDPLRAACARTRTAAILGAAWRDADDRRRLAALILTPDGGLGASSKRHLHGREREVFEAGEPAAPFELDGWRVATAVCFDVAHPTHAADAAARGADLYVGSSFYSPGEERRSDLHFGARAMDHRMFAALANYPMVPGGYAACGGSGAWRPTGAAMVRAGTGPELVVVELDRRELDAFRTPR